MTTAPTTSASGQRVGVPGAATGAGSQATGAAATGEGATHTGAGGATAGAADRLANGFVSPARAAAPARSSTVRSGNAREVHCVPDQ